MPRPERVFTLRELTRLLRLTPKRAGQLRRLGLLSGDVAGYRFRELVSARAASALLEGGATVRQVREALDGARRLAPNALTPLAELRLRVQDQKIVVEHDRLRLDPRTGQALLDFESGDLERETRESLLMGMVRPLIPPADTAEIWFARAPACYRAALEADDSCCQAAFNLGSLHEDLSDLPTAIGWYRRALEMEPDYADAHFNLAGVLGKAGQADAAALHWRRYLELDLGSPWARIARSHLEEADGGLGEGLGEGVDEGDDSPGAGQ